MENKEDANGSVRQMEDFSAEQPTGILIPLKEPVERVLNFPQSNSTVLCEA